MDSRLSDHNSGKVKYTKPGIPWQVVLTIEKSTISEVRILERKVKNFNSRKRLEQFIKSTNRFDSPDESPLKAIVRASHTTKITKNPEIPQGFLLIYEFRQLWQFIYSVYEQTC